MTVIPLLFDIILKKNVNYTSLFIKSDHVRCLLIVTELKNLNDT